MAVNIDSWNNVLEMKWEITSPWHDGLTTSSAAAATTHQPTIQCGIGGPNFGCEREL